MPQNGRVSDIYETNKRSKKTENEERTESANYTKEAKTTTNKKFGASIDLQRSAYQYFYCAKSRRQYRYMFLSFNLSR